PGRRVGAGETFVVPPAAPHTFAVEADEPARFITEFRPGMRLAEFFAQIFWLADHGHVDAKGRIHPLQAAVLARAFPHEFFYLPTVPAALQQAIARPLAALARRRGYSADPARLADLAAPVDVPRTDLPSPHRPLHTSVHAGLGRDVRANSPKIWRGQRPAARKARR